MGERWVKTPRSTELHSLFYQCSYTVLKQTRKQTESFGAFLNWKAVLSWIVSRIEEGKKRQKTSKEQMESFVNSKKQRREAQVTPEFLMKWMTVASHRHHPLEWADRILWRNLPLDSVCFICMHGSLSQCLSALTAVEAMSLLWEGGIKVSCGDAQSHCTQESACGFSVILCYESLKTMKLGCLNCLVCSICRVVVPRGLSPGFQSKVLWSPPQRAPGWRRMHQGAGGTAGKCRAISLKLIFAFSQQSTELSACNRCS